MFGAHQLGLGVGLQHLPQHPQRLRRVQALVQFLALHFQGQAQQRYVDLAPGQVFTDGLGLGFHVGGLLHKGTALFCAPEQSLALQRQSGQPSQQHDHRGHPEPLARTLGQVVSAQVGCRQLTRRSLARQRQHLGQQAGSLARCHGRQQRQPLVLQACTQIGCRVHGQDLRPGVALDDAVVCQVFERERHLARLQIRLGFQQQAREHRHPVVQQHHAHAIGQAQAQQQPALARQMGLARGPVGHEVAERPDALDGMLRLHERIELPHQHRGRHPHRMQPKGLGQQRLGRSGLPACVQRHIGQQGLVLHLDEALPVAAHEARHLDAHMGFFDQVGHHAHPDGCAGWLRQGLALGIEPLRLRRVDQQQVGARRRAQRHARILEMVS